MLKKLKIKFVAITMSLVTVMLCAILGLVLFFSQASLEQESLRLLQNAGTMDFRPGRPGKGGNAAVFTMVFNARGDLVVSGSSYYDLSDQEYLLSIAREAMDAKKDMGKLRDYDLRYYREETPLGIRLSFSDISRERQTMRSLTLVSAAIGAASLAVFLGISLLLANWVVRPVEKAWQAQRQFVADASHELKTPLTVITTNAELLLQEGREGEEKHRYSGNILAMAQQMRRLVESMLELARGDNSGLNANFESVSLSNLAEEACLLFEPVAFEQGLSLEAAVAPDIWVQGSASHLRQVAEVLLDNAVKYSTKPGEIWLRVGQKNKDCFLAVENPGPEIPREEQEKLFRRFYRGDRARTGDSFGLGLAIAQSIVDNHGGKIWVESSGGINRFVVQLPMS